MPGVRGDDPGYTVLPQPREVPAVGSVSLLKWLAYPKSPLSPRWTPKTGH